MVIAIYCSEFVSHIRCVRVCVLESLGVSIPLRRMLLKSCVGELNCAKYLIQCKLICTVWDWDETRQSKTWFLSSRRKHFSSNQSNPLHISIHKQQKNKKKISNSFASYNGSIEFAPCKHLECIKQSRNCYKLKLIFPHSQINTQRYCYSKNIKYLNHFCYVHRSALHCAR